MGRNTERGKAPSISPARITMGKNDKVDHTEGKGER